MIYIGIDPAFRKDGIGCCVIEGDTINFPKIGSFITFVEFVDDLNPDDVVMVIENSNLQNVTFIRTGNARKDKKISRNVGMNQAISQMFFDYAKHKLKHVHEISPKTKGRKLSHQDITPLFAKYNTVNNYKGNKTEQDKRDAFKLAFLAKNIFKKLAE